MAGLALIPVMRGAEAQQKTKVYRIAYLGSGSFASSGRYAVSFRDALRRLGYVDGQNLTIDYEWAEGRFERLPSLIDGLLARDPDVIISFGGAQVTRALKSATRTVPVVFLTDDPVAEGVVGTLARPGGNLTGVSVIGANLDPKRVQLIKEALPHAARIAILNNPDRPRAAEQLDNVASAAKELGLAVEFTAARSPDELDRAFSALAQVKADAMLVVTDPMLNVERARIVEFAARQRLPAIYFWREFVEAGGLMSYGTSLDDMHRRMAIYVDKILKGAKPGDLPIEQPTRFELVVNLKTAKTLGLSLPASILVRADEVIE